MKIIRTISELQKQLNRNYRNELTVGFVPTMGFLHEGHLSLVEKARQQNDIVVMSIFVNPTQFGPNEDFETYPRDEEQDSVKAKAAGVDILFLPSVEEIYPEKSEMNILPGAQANVLCGSSRSGHFDGVLKVVLKLFNIVDPDDSYFGLKDAQQLAIIETFVRDFNLRTKIVRVQTVREEDGLAKSSRNVRLNEQEREQSTILYEALQIGKKLFEKGNQQEMIEQEVKNHIIKNSTGTIDYVSLLAYPTLSPYKKETKEAILACAVNFEKARLIDNVIMANGR